LVAEGKPYGMIAEICSTLPELMRIAIQHLPSATAKAPRD